MLIKRKLKDINYCEFWLSCQMGASCYSCIVVHVAKCKTIFKNLKTPKVHQIAAEFRKTRKKLQIFLSQKLRKLRNSLFQSFAFKCLSGLNQNFTVINMILISSSKKHTLPDFYNRSKKAKTIYFSFSTMRFYKT